MRGEDKIPLLPNSLKVMISLTPMSLISLLKPLKTMNSLMPMNPLVFMNLPGLLSLFPLLYHYNLTIASLYLIAIVKLRQKHRLLLKPPTKNSLGPGSRSVLTIVA